MKKFLLNIFIFLLFLFVGLFILEGVLRIFFDPIDYLKPEIVAHPALGHKIKPNSNRHDSWGFRNEKVPDRVDIVTIGDSQTYGDWAPMEGSWPYRLGELTGKKVYNLSLGGYGPAQYLFLLKEKSLQLNPSQIIVGLYCGNDFFNSYEMVYGYEYWKEYRNKECDFDSIQIMTRKVLEIDNQNSLGWIYRWLDKNSILYRKISDFVYQNMIINNNKILGDPRFTFFYDADNDIRTGFKSKTRLNEINDGDPANSDGYRIAIKMLSEMREICKAKDIKFSIVVIPTKSLVFWDLIKKNINTGKFEDIRKIVESELNWRELLFRDLSELDIEYIDALSKMREAQGRTKIYDEDLNDHPNQAGYEIIAKVAAEIVK